MSGQIWITGDIHHMSMNGTDQKILKQKESDHTEVGLCEPYLEIANQYGFEPTLFFTGQSILEEGNKVKELINKFSFSIGGHTFSAYQPTIISRISNKITGSPYPSKHSQLQDIKKTMDTINDILGIKIKKWRNHAYRTNRYTYQLLSNIGFECVSNEVNQEKYDKEKVSGNLYSFPINTIPDHENLFHSPEHQEGMEPEILVEENVKLVEDILAKDGTATLLLHPLCMYLEDKFFSMKKLLAIISRFNK